MIEFNYLPIEKVLFGIDSNSYIPDILKNGRRILVIVSKSASSTPVFNSIMDSLNYNNNEIDIYTGIRMHSPKEEIDEVISDRIREKYDALISYGGGSVIDASKIIRKELNIKTMIAIPTTLSASEFSHIAGYTDNKEKKGIRDKSITPSIVVLDPHNTLDVPYNIYISSGFRSIDHAIESTLDIPFYHPRLITSSESYKILRENLIRTDLESRLNSQIGAWLSYMNVYDAPMGYSHQLGKVIGARHNIPHGYTSLMLLPKMVELYAINDRLHNFLMRVFGSNDYDLLIRELENLISYANINLHLSQYNVTSDEITEISARFGEDSDRLRKLLFEIL